jgi:hypothetical protein
MISITLCLTEWQGQRPARRFNRAEIILGQTAFLAHISTFFAPHLPNFSLSDAPQAQLLKIAMYTSYPAFPERGTWWSAAKRQTNKENQHTLAILAHKQNTSSVHIEFAWACATTYHNWYRWISYRFSCDLHPKFLSLAWRELQKTQDFLEYVCVPRVILHRGRGTGGPRSQALPSCRGKTLVGAGHVSL